MKSNSSKSCALQVLLSRLSMAIISATLFTFIYGQASAKVPNGLAPGTVVMKMTCSAQHGHFIGHSFIMGVESGPFTIEGRPPGPTNDATLEVFTSNQMPFAAQSALGGGPVLEYTPLSCLVPRSANLP